MKADAFGELLKSVRQAGNIRRGTLKPSRVTKVKPADIKAAARYEQEKRGVKILFSARS